MIDFTKNIDRIIHNIEAARIRLSEHHIVKIIAVSKYASSGQVQALYENGQRAFGENKIQSLTQKQDELDELPLEWHFIGKLQTNKINKLIDANPHLMQSLDSFELAQELQKRLDREGKTMDCLLQINGANDSNKIGFDAELSHDNYLKIQETCPNIKLQGVMGIGAFTDDKKAIAKSFESVHQDIRRFATFWGDHLLYGYEWGL